MPAPPSSKQREANQRSMDAARQGTSNAGGTMSGVRSSGSGNVQTRNAGGTQSGVRSGTTTQVRDSSSYSNNNTAARQAVERSQYQRATAAQMQAAERSNYRSPPGFVQRTIGGGGGSQEAVMRHLNMGRPLIGPGQTSGPGKGDRLGNIIRQIGYNPLNNMTQPVVRQSIPIPRQNPLSDPSKFIYDPGRDRDYIMQGDTSIDPAGEMDQSAVSRLVAMQQRYGEPFRVTSGYRGPNLNRKAKGAPSSTHLPNVAGEAFDIHTDDTSREAYARLAAAAKQSGFEGGYGAYRPGSLHVDTGVPRMWGSSANKKTVMAGINDRSIIAAAGLPPRKQTVLSALKKGVDNLKGFLSPEDAIPIPRQKPSYPSQVAAATGAPIPQMKPRYASLVAPALSAPVPRMKPAQQQMARIEPASNDSNGYDWGAIPGVNSIKTAYNNVNQNVLQPIAQGVQNYGVNATQNYVDAKINAMRGQPSKFARAYAKRENYRESTNAMNRRLRKKGIQMGMGYA